MPPVSIIITAHEQCDVLRRYLPIWFEQDYPADYEVIVVDMNSTDETSTVLEGLRMRNPHLRLICLPDSSRDVSPTRLAITLGIRAACYEWLVFTKADCIPASAHWLKRMMESGEQRPSVQIVLGPSRFVGGHGWHGLRCRFFRVWQESLYLPHAIRHGAYRSDGTNLAYRRTLFLEHRGFADHATLLAGATDIMVNHHSTADNTAICLHPEAVILEDTPQDTSWWSHERLFFMETRRHFQHKFNYRWRYFTTAILPWLCTLSAMSVITLGFLWHNYYAVGLALLAWLSYIIYSSIVFNCRLRTIGEPPIILPLPLLFHLVLYWDTTAWLHWLFTDKQVFKKRFI